MPGSDPIATQRAVRSKLQAAARDMADPHQVATSVLSDLRAVGDGLQDHRQTNPLLAELGDTLNEAVKLMENLCDQVKSLKAQGESAQAETF